MKMNDLEKMIIYQVFPRWFGNKNASLVPNGSISENGVGKFSDFSTLALDKIKKLGATHIWYTGVIEHATQTDYSAYHISQDHPAVVKGKAGSPYAIKDYYDVDPDLADEVPMRMVEFESLVRRTHEAGLKVIIDFVPNHVARQYHSDSRFLYIDDLGQKDDVNKAFDPNNNFYYIPGQPLSLACSSDDLGLPYSEFPAKATGNDHFDAFPGKNDWYETVKLNYGVDYLNGRQTHFDPIPDTWQKMLNILMFWAGKDVDGFRCDMAEMVPVEFWNWAIPTVKEEFDVDFIAEVYNPSQYRNYLFNGHFDYLYDKVGLYDTLRAVICGQAPASRISSCWQSLDGIQSKMLNFLENHDEQRIASDFFANDGRWGISGLMVSALMNTNPFMIYAGQEMGERGMDAEGFSGKDGRTTIFDYWSLETLRNWNNGRRFDGGLLTDEQKSLRETYSKVLNIARMEPAITRGVFFDLMYKNQENRFFNNHNQYAFLRKYKNELVLVVANFSRSNQEVCVNIPAEAFDALGLKDNVAARQIDLMNGEETIAALTTAWPFKLHLPGGSGRIIKFIYDL